MVVDLIANHNPNRPLPFYAGMIDSAFAPKLEAEGVTRGKAEALLAVLTARGIAIGDADRAQILGESDPARLERWLASAVTCAEATELFTMHGGR